MKRTRSAQNASENPSENPSENAAKKAKKPKSKRRSIFVCGNTQDSILLEDFTTENTNDTIRLVYYTNNDEVPHVECFLKNSLQSIILKNSEKKRTNHNILFIQ